MDERVGITVVDGYVPADQPPADARECQLRKKVGIVVHRDPRNTGEEPFPTEVYVALAYLVWQSLSPDFAEAQRGPAAPTSTAESVRELPMICSTDDTGLYPMRRLRFVKGDRPIAIFASTLWTTVGGPWPYWDDVSIDIYTNACMLNEIQALLSTMQRNGTIASLNVVSGDKAFPSMTRRIIRWVQSLMQ